MPAHDGGGLDEHEDVPPAGPPTRQRDPEEPVGPSEGRARAAAPKNGKLLKLESFSATIADVRSVEPTEFINCFGLTRIPATHHFGR